MTRRPPAAILSADTYAVLYAARCTLSSLPPAERGSPCSSCTRSLSPAVGCPPCRRLYAVLLTAGCEQSSLPPAVRGPPCRRLYAVLLAAGCTRSSFRYRFRFPHCRRQYMRSSLPPSVYVVLLATSLAHR